MKIRIVGDGVFGQFLNEIFSPHTEICDDAHNLFLAIPGDAYEEVARQNAGMHLINVCSVQQETNRSCLRYSEYVTGIHPLFGPRSPAENRVALLTQRCEKSAAVIELFEKVGAEVFASLPDGKAIDGELHDRMMAATHLAGLRQLAQLKEIVEKSAWVPEKFIPTSFLRLRNFVEQSGDFSPGTLKSIESNPFSEEEN